MDNLKGIYALTIRLGSGTTIRYGRQEKTFPAGYGVYIGSAMSGLAGRLGRHLRTSQVRHWHVDALLAAGRVVDLQVLVTDDPTAECRAATRIGSWSAAEPVPDFGASDCGCATHLYFFPKPPRGALLAERVLPTLPEIYGRLRKLYRNHALFERDPFETLVKCILSLRTQDPVTDQAAVRLFAVLRTPQEFAVAEADRIAGLIYPVGMYRQKAKNLIRIARELLDRCNGETPAEIDALITLPGVGRKTANLVRSFAFHLPAICVDTHVHRITNRWGLVRTRTPDETEAELRRILPAAYWIETNALLIQHGQQCCRPIGPRCDRCALRGLCRYEDLKTERRLLADLPGALKHPSLDIKFEEKAFGGKLFRKKVVPPNPFSKTFTA